MFAVAPVAYSESDEAILEKVRSKATAIALEQASWTLPGFFHKSGLVASVKDGLNNCITARR